MRRLRYLGDKVLRKKCDPVKKVRPEIKTLVEDMFETMEVSHGIGLAAPQIGISKQILVVDVPNEDGISDRFALINPRIVRFEGGKVAAEEGCLSIPGVAAEVTRPEGVVVAGISEQGKKVEIEVYDLLARCLQHEIDHLNGILFIDRAGVPEEKARKEMDEYLTSSDD